MLQFDLNVLLQKPLHTAKQAFRNSVTWHFRSGRIGMSRLLRLLQFR